LHLPGLKRGGNFVDSKKILLKDLKRNRIDYAILIPDNVTGSEIGDLDTILELTKNDKQLFLMGTLNILKDTKSILNRLDSLFECQRIVGIKIFPGHDPIYPTDVRLIPVYELCIKYNLPIVIHTGWNSQNPGVAKYNDPKYIIRIAKKFPRLKIVISHYFWPKVEYCYDLTKSFQNIHFDTSGLADDEVIRETGLKKIEKVLTDTTVERPDNILFGTDYAMCDIKKHVDFINTLKLTRRQKGRIFYRNSIKLFKLTLE